MISIKRINCSGIRGIYSVCRQVWLPFWKSSFWSERLGQYARAAWTVLFFSDPFRGNLKLSAQLLAAFLSCIVSKKIRKPDAVNLPILVSDWRAFVEVVCFPISKQIKAIKINKFKCLIHLGSIYAAYRYLNLLYVPQRLVINRAYDSSRLFLQTVLSCSLQILVLNSK